MPEALIGFISGVGVSVVAVFVGSYVQRQDEKKRRIRNHQIQVYSKLSDLYHQYFWVASLELRGEEVDSDIKSKIRNLAWEITNILRLEEEVPFSEEIFRVLMSNEHESASVRHNEMSEILDKMNNELHPKLSEVIKTLSRDNIRRIATGDRPIQKSTVPGFLWP